MFTPEERARLRSELIEQARADTRIIGAAITGSGAVEREDRWSDIDLAFAIAGDADVASVLSDWTRQMYDRHGAAHHLDIRAGLWTYRVFLLPSTLQVDLAFVTAAEFRALAPTFRLLFGTAHDSRPFPAPAPADIIGFAWLYALHARSSIARGRLWQAEFMISAVRDSALALACIRHGLPAAHGRGMDQLPAEVLGPFESTLVRRLHAAELWRTFGLVISELIAEVRWADEGLAERLEPALKRLCDVAA